MTNVNENKNINYGDLYGLLGFDNTFWDDKEDLNQDITNFKIINVKIFYNSGKEEIFDDEVDSFEEEEKEEKEENKKEIIIEEKYIVGINITYKNLYNGEIKVLEHKGDDKISGMKELKIKGGEYLKCFNINFKNNLKQISQISFSTNKNNSITVGIKDGEDKEIEQNKKDNIIVGLFGHYLKRINAVGCIYTEKNYFIKQYLFGFFFLRKLALKNKEFKEKWDKNIKILDTPFQYMWKTINLPDALFSKIIGISFI